MALKISKRKTKKKSKNPEEVLLVAQEIKFARLLAGNEKRSRDKVLKTLKKWFSIRFEKSYEFKEDDFTRIWKGLFYAVWMSDKPLVQEELCESVAGILDLFPPAEHRHAALFLRCALLTLATEWYGIDQHRIDKFLMLVRRVVRAAFRCVQRCGWSEEACQSFAEALSADGALFAPATPSHARNALALQLHFTDCYLEEMAKVSEGSIPGEAVSELVRPLVQYMALGSEARLCGSVKRNVFTYLLRQSLLGQDYEEARQAWNRMGCPAGGVESMEKVPLSDEEQSQDEDSDSEGDSKALDPRAGHVDVVLPSLPVPCAELVLQLTPFLSDRRTSTANRKRVRTCICQLQEMTEGTYPLRVRGEVPARRDPSLKMPRPRRSAHRLRALERRLTASADELALRGLSRKHRKRLLARARDGQNIVEEASSEPAEGPSAPKKTKRTKKDTRSTHATQIGSWQIEDTKTDNTEKSAGKENVPQKEKTKEKKRKHTATPQEEVLSKKVKTTLKNSEDNIPQMGTLKKNTKEDILKINGDSQKVDKQSSKSKNPAKEAVKMTMNKTKVKKFEKKSSPSQKQNIPVIIPEKVNKTSIAKLMTNKGPKNFEKQSSQKQKESLKEIKQKENSKSLNSSTPKKVKIVLKNNTMQGHVDYYKSVRQSPSIPFDGTKKPVKTNLKPNSAPSPINPFFKRKMKMRS